MLSSDEDAVRVGVQAGDAALAGFDASGVLKLFTDQTRRKKSAQRLDVLRTYAELGRAQLPSGYDIPATSLVAAGYTAGEIAQFNAMIAAFPAKAAPGMGHAAQATATSANFLRIASSSGRLFSEKEGVSK
jgi:hypothetical protein